MARYPAQLMNHKEILSRSENRCVIETEGGSGATAAEGELTPIL